ncbi:MAG TPA: hypothetical protein VK253_07325 [Candidatus Binatia bacterium]|nr:hypothetical protein [Candidatus Binatia bacterium]
MLDLKHDLQSSTEGLKKDVETKAAGDYETEVKWSDEDSKAIFYL